MRRLVIVDPAFHSSVGHHGEVNRPLLKALQQGGWAAELWADVALEAQTDAPQPLCGVFSGCGYEDARHWRELGGMVQLARRLEQQLALAASGGTAVQAWVAHSLLPFQLLGLARHLATAPPAQVLLSLMYAPGETLQGPPADPQASANCRVALAALARTAAQQGHRLKLVFPSRQQQVLYAPVLAATGLASSGLHPAVVGGGCQPLLPPSDAPPLVLLHWGDLKEGKGRREALAVLEGLIEQGGVAGWGWLFHHHSASAMEPQEDALLDRAEQARMGLVRLEGEVASQAMQNWLARCPVALLAYDPVVYAERSSGMLWQWAASRLALDAGAAGVGYGNGWLAREASDLGLAWHSPEQPTAAGWITALERARVGARAASALNSQAKMTLLQHFGSWCRQQLADNLH